VGFLLSMVNPFLSHYKYLTSSLLSTVVI
jgi:hypothetical protein